MGTSTSPLGKGLAALISEEAAKAPEQSYIPNLPIDKIVPNPSQPRLNLSPESLVELSDSIREHGVIEPLIVSKDKVGDKYVLIAGERRWRAAQMAQLKTVPVVIKESTPLQMLELAIIENIQRKDLNALEEALAFHQLHDEYGLSVKEIAQKMGISRPAVSNKLRLLALPKQLKEALINEELSEGHARALLGLSSDAAMVAALRIVQRDKLSVRATETLVRKLSFEEKKHLNAQKAKAMWSPRAEEISNLLAERLNAKVNLTRSTRGGKLVIPFKDDEELEGIYARLES